MTDFILRFARLNSIGFDLGEMILKRQKAQAI